MNAKTLRGTLTLILVSWLLFTGCAYLGEMLTLQNAIHFSSGAFVIGLLIKLLPWLVLGFMMAVLFKTMTASLGLAALFLAATVVSLVLCVKLGLPLKAVHSDSLTPISAYGAGQFYPPLDTAYALGLLSCYTLGLAIKK